MKILVTGGAGYIGSHTVKELVRKNYQIVVYDSLAHGHRQAVDPKGKLVVNDLGDLDKLDKTFKKELPDAVIHFAGFIEVNESVKNPAKYYINNVCFGLNLLESMAKYKTRYIIYSSSAGIYGQPKHMPIKEDDPKEPINTYGRTKLMFEKILASYEEAYDIKYCALRYFNAAGASRNAEIGEDHDPETHIIPLIIQTALGQRKEFILFGKDYKTPDGTCVRDYVHVEDLGRAHHLALKHLQKTKKSDIFNLGVGKGFSNLELVEAVKKVSGADLPVKYGPRREGDPDELVADSTRARKILNWQPEYVKIGDIIRTAWEWHKNHPCGFSNPKS